MLADSSIANAQFETLRPADHRRWSIGMKESYEFLSIPKSTGTYGDIFAAVGLANVLSVIPDANPVAIEERDAEFQVIPSRPILMSDLERVPHLPGYAYLRPNEKAPVPASIADYVD